MDLEGQTIRPLANDVLFAKKCLAKKRPWPGRSSDHTWAAQFRPDLPALTSLPAVTISGQAFGPRDRQGTFSDLLF